VGHLSIALVHPYLWGEVLRGGERYVDELSEYLITAGHQVDILTGAEGSGGAYRRENGVTVRRRRHLRHFRFSRFGVTDVESFGLAVLPELTRRRYDIVHAMTPTAALASRLAGQTTIYTVLGHPSEEQLQGRAFDRSLMRAAVSAAHEVTALSHASAAATERVFGRAAVGLTPGIYCDRFPPNLAPRAGPVRILFPAALGDRRKGLDRAIRAVASLREDWPDMKLLLSGQGSWSWALEDLEGGAEAMAGAIEDLGPGSPDRMPERYRSATISMLPSTDEAFGLVLAESLACGTPVVCTQDGGMPEIVSSPEVGRTVPAGHGQAWEQAVRQVVRLAAEPGTPARCSDHVRKFDWSLSIGPAHVELYRQVIAGRSRRRRPRHTSAATP
jgi:glycosyltransferase involved in cell wall biosynthesis